MKLRSIKIDKKFTPEFNENKSLPIGEQMVIYFNRIPGTSEKSNYKDYKFNQKGDIQLAYNDQLMVSSFVERIENLEDEVDGRVVKIKTGVALSALNNHLLAELFTEIRDYLFPDSEGLDEGEQKA